MLVVSAGFFAEIRFLKLRLEEAVLSWTIIAARCLSIVRGYSGPQFSSKRPAIAQVKVVPCVLSLGLPLEGAVHFHQTVRQLSPV